MATFKNQEEKDKAVAAQQKVVDSAEGQPELAKAQAKLDELNAQEVE